MEQYTAQLINLARNIGGSVGISLVTTLQARLAQRHEVNLISHMTPLDGAYRQALQGLKATLQARGGDWTEAAHQAQTMLYGEMQRQANMLAFG